MAGNRVDCPCCGKTYGALGLAAHIGSRPCNVNEFLRKMGEKNYVHVSAPYASMLMKSKTLPWERGPWAYRPGWVGRRARIVYGVFTPKWVAELIAKRWSGIMTFAGPVKLTVKQLRKVLHIE